MVLGIAFVTSFSSGSSGAEILGYPAQFVASVPLICDIVAALAAIVHGRVRNDPPMRRLAAWFVLVPMSLSWASQGLAHVFRAPRPGVLVAAPPDLPDGTPGSPQWPTDIQWDLAQWTWITGVVIFAGLAPVAVAGLLHFMAKFVDYERRPAVGSVSESQAETVDTTPEIEPEFVEPALRIPALTVPTVEAVPEVDAETVREIDEIEIHRVMRETKPRVSREVAEIMVRDGVSRATAYRRAQKGADDAAALA